MSCATRALLLINKLGSLRLVNDQNRNFSETEINQNFGFFKTDPKPIQKFQQNYFQTRYRKFRLIITIKKLHFFVFASSSLHFIRSNFYARSFIQVSLVIRGRNVPSFWTANLEFADKKSIFDWKSVILGHISNVNKRISG